MLKATLDAVARLDYPHFECVVVINNTPDPAFWRPIEEHCRALGERFKFINDDDVSRLQGRRAAARARAHRRRRRDHRRHRCRLRRAAGLAEGSGAAFADPKVGMVQAPQDHRDGERSVMHHAMNGEYSGFFDIGMVQRNEANAIIVHGTMCLIRRTAMDLRRRLVERHHRRGLPISACTSSSTAGRSTTPTGATVTASCPTLSRPTRSSATAGPMAACRFCKKHWRVPAAARAAA